LVEIDVVRSQPPERRGERRGYHVRGGTHTNENGNEGHLGFGWWVFLVGRACGRVMDRRRRKKKTPGDPENALMT